MPGSNHGFHTREFVDDLLLTLKTTFGYDAFRPLQREIIQDALAGRWVGRPRIHTIDVDIELEFTKNADGTVNGKLIGTNLGPIDRTLRSFAVADDTVYFTLPNVDPWRFSGELGDGTITGVVASAQGGVPVTFRKQTGRPR